MLKIPITEALKTLPSTSKTSRRTHSISTLPKPQTTLLPFETIQNFKATLEKRLKIFNEFVEIFQQHSLFTSVKTKVSEKIISETEKILALYNIKLSLITSQLENASLRAIVDREQLTCVLIDFVQELCKLPFTFVLKLRIKKIVFCDKIDQDPKIPSRFLGLGTIEVSKCFKTLNTQWALYCVLMDFFLLKHSDFLSEWGGYVSILRPFTIGAKQCFLDIVSTFRLIEKNILNSYTLGEQEQALKVWKLRNKLREFDPQGYPYFMSIKIELSVKPYKNKLPDLRTLKLVPV